MSGICRGSNPGRWIGNPRFTQWAIEDPDAECKVKFVLFSPRQNGVSKNATCLGTAKTRTQEVDPKAQKHSKR